MIAVPQEAEILIRDNQLGTPQAVYRPATIESIVFAVLLFAFATGWIWVTASIMGNPWLPENLSLFHFFHPYGPVPISVTPDAVGESASPIWSIVSFAFPVFGLIFALGALSAIIRAIRNSSVKAIVCSEGLVSIERKRSDAFRWEQMATVFHDVKESVSRTTTGDGVTTTSRHFSHKYIVTCKDGRRFVFDNTLAHVTKLGSTIEYEVASRRQNV